MKHTAFLLLSIVALIALPRQRATGQVPDSKLREHIVHGPDDKGQDVYRDDRIPTIEDTSICFIYVGRKQSGPLWLRLQVRYAGYQSLNITKIKFAKGDKAVELHPIPEFLHHGNNGMIQWEWYDSPPSENEMKAIRAIIAGPGVTLTLTGTKTTIEREISETERLAMDNMLQQARILGRNQ